MSQAEDGSTRTLGLLVLASSVASFLSSYVWGRLADRSSRQVLIFSGLAGALALILALILPASSVVIALVLFGLMIAYHGVRQGRSTYLVDMAPDDQRAAYTAVSNTVVGVVLLLVGLVTAALGAADAPYAIAAFAVLCLLGSLIAYRMPEADDA